MSNIVQMKSNTIEQVVNEIHKQFASAQDNDKKAYRARIRAGQLLNDLRPRIESGEAGHVHWWDWYAANFVRSRRDAEKCMAIADADDPDAAHEAEKEETKLRVREHRAEEKTKQFQSQNAPYVRRTDESDDDVLSRQPHQFDEQSELVTTTLRLVAQMDAEHRQTCFAELKRKYDL